MKTTKHTPGPWTYTETGSSDRYMIHSNLSHRKHVSTEEHVATIETINKANAYLIASAPEMLIEIERYLSIAKRENWYATVSDLEKLIAKATNSERNEK